MLIQKWKVANTVVVVVVGLLNKGSQALSSKKDTKRLADPR